MSMILLEPAYKITQCKAGDQAADHLSNAVWEQRCGCLGFPLLLSHLYFFFSRAGFGRTNGRKMSSTNSVITALGTGFKAIRSSCRTKSVFARTPLQSARSMGQDSLLKQYNRPVLRRVGIGY